MGWSSKYPGYQNGKEGDGLVVRSEGKLEGVVPKLFAQTILDMKLEMQKKHPMFSGFLLDAFSETEMVQGGLWSIMHSKIQVCW